MTIEKLKNKLLEKKKWSMKLDIIFQDLVWKWVSIITTQPGNNTKKENLCVATKKDTMTHWVLFYSTVIQNDTRAFNGTWHTLDTPFLNLASNLSHRACD